MPTLQLGLIVSLTANVEDSFRQVADAGVPTCQLSCWNPAILTPDLADKVRAAAQRSGITVSSLWAGHSGLTRWNFLQGPLTIGLVPAAYRGLRLGELKRGADFAALIGAPSITTHVGFIPEDPNDPNYAGVVVCLQELAGHCKRHGLIFLFETGQETPVTLLRTIQDIGTDNLGINLDPANLILYGKANPVDALDVFGQFVKGMHAKDGLYPTDGRSLGKETALGEGKVEFPRLLARLKQFNFPGPITIEREIHGPQQLTDIKRAIALLTPLL